MGNETKMNRRKFMEVGIFGISGAVAAVSGVALARFAVGSSFQQEESKWIALDLDLRSDEPDFERVVLEYEKKDGWLVTQAKALAYLKRTGKGEIVAISATCRHLGCIVSWVPEKKIFQCPCHNGKYDAEGRVISGPPPGPLKRHKTKIEDGKIWLSTETVPYQGESHGRA